MKLESVAALWGRWYSLLDKALGQGWVDAIDDRQDVLISLFCDERGIRVAVDARWVLEEEGWVTRVRDLAIGKLGCAILEARVERDRGKLRDSSGACWSAESARASSHRDSETLPPR
jgi:hypothetical protein